MLLVYWREESWSIKMDQFQKNLWVLVDCYAHELRFVEQVEQ